MASMTIRDIDDADYENLRRIAKANNRSAAAHLRAIIADLEPPKRTREQAVADLLEFRKKHPIRLAPGEDAVSLIRAIRDEE
jgi:plasmid stability protein